MEGCGRRSVVGIAQGCAVSVKSGERRVDYVASTGAAVLFLDCRYPAKPTLPKPSSIMAQVESSGTALEDKTASKSDVWSRSLKKCIIVNASKHNE